MSDDVLTEDEALRSQNFFAAMAASPVPVVTYALIAINLLIFVAMMFSQASLLMPTPQEAIRWGADFGPLTFNGQWWRIITCCFVHFGFIHVAMNMFILFQVGIFTEKLFGNVRFLLLYLLAGVGGSLASLAVHPLSASAGASGAVFGVYGALLGFLLIQRGVVPSASAASIAKSAGIFLVINVFYGLRSAGTDMTAHGGGLLTGFVVGCLLARPLFASGQRLYPVRTLAVALGGIVLAYLAFGVVAKRSGPKNAWEQQVMSGKSVTVRDNNRVIYTGSATRADANNLASALFKAGYFAQSNGVVLLSKSRDGTVVSIPTGEVDTTRPHDGLPGIPETSKRMAPFAWDDPHYLARVENTGVVIAPSVGGPPIKIALLSSTGDVEKVVPINTHVATIGTKDSIWYSGTATQQDAEALGMSLQENKFFRDDGRRFYLSKGSDGADISFTVKDGAWDDPTLVAAFQSIGRKLAKSVNGSPVRFHLLDGDKQSRKDWVVK
jgi:rhomboid protease GluP